MMSWLPSNLLPNMGRVAAVVVGELLPDTGWALQARAQGCRATENFTTIA